MVAQHATSGVPEGERIAAPAPRPVGRTTPGDLISGQLARFVKRGAVRAGLVGDAETERNALGDADELAVLRRLLLLLAEPGHLEIATDDRRYHVLFTGSLDLAVALDPGPASEVDLWLSQIASAHRNEVKA